MDWGFGTGGGAAANNSGWSGGGAATNTANNAWGAGGGANNLWNAAPQQQQPAGWGLQGGAGVNLNLGDVKGSKRYADVEPEVKKALLFLERRFLNEKNVIEGNKKHLAAPLPTIARDMKAVEAKLDFWMEHLERQYESVQEFRSTVNKELKSAETAYFLLKKLHTYEQTQEPLPSDYFWDLTNNFEKRMQECRQKIEELEQYLASARNPRQYTPKMLLDTIDNQHEFFITLTATLAAVHEQVDVLREDFVVLQKRLDRNYRGNPFEEASKYRTEKSLRKVADQKLKKKQAAPALAAWGAQPASATPNAAFGAPAATGAAAGANAGGFSFGTGAGAAGTGAAATGGFSFGAPAATGGGAGANSGGAGGGAGGVGGGGGGGGGWGTGPAAADTSAFSFGGGGGASNASTTGFSFGDSNAGAKRSGYGDLQ